jgi:hypothetical protein
MIHPERNCFTPKWDKMVMLALVYVALWTPYEIGLMHDKAKEGITWLGPLNLFIDGLFGFDIILQFFLMYPSQTSLGTVWIKDPHKIAKNYMRGWFIIDIVSVFPFDLVADIVFADSSSGDLQILKVIRAIRLLKMARVLRAGRILGRLQANSSMSMQYLEIGFVLIKMILAGHWAACIWGFVGVVGYDYTVPVEAQDPSSSWIASKDPAKLGRWDSHYDLWLAGFQWSIQTLTSIGYGDVLPVNTFEHAMNIFLMMVLAMVWIRTLGTMTAYMTTLIGQNLKLYETMDDLNSLMNEHNLAKPLKTQLRMYFRKARTTDTMRWFVCLSEMSPFLRNQAVKHANTLWINDAPFLQNAGDTFMGDLSLTFKMDILSMGERFGNVRTFYIINNGLVARRGRVMRRGNVFGEDVVLSCIPLCEDPSAFSLIYSEMWSLSHEDLYAVLDKEDEYEAERVMIRRYAVRRAVIRGVIREARLRREDPTRRFDPSLVVERPKQVCLDENLQAGIFSDLQGVQDRLGQVQETLGALKTVRDLDFIS